MEPLFCQVCGVLLTGKRRITCSNRACLLEMDRRRHAEKYRVEKREEYTSVEIAARGLRQKEKVETIHTPLQLQRLSGDRLIRAVDAIIERDCRMHGISYGEDT
jgi:hypothetical protein